ncbi:hypothetical protein [Pseudomonas sp. LB3P58]
MINHLMLDRRSLDDEYRRRPGVPDNISEITLIANDLFLQFLPMPVSPDHQPLPRRVVTRHTPSPLLNIAIQR